MESNLDRYLDSQEDNGYRTLTFKLWKGKKLIRTWESEVSNEDGCYEPMETALVRVHTKEQLELSKVSHISHKTGFNIVRMGKYSVTCYDAPND
jgi:hypothetical protein